MKWKNKELKTYPEIIDFALKLKGDKQKEFVDTYAKSGPYALQNVGYFSGYYDHRTMAKIQRVFQTAHPIFGRMNPSTKYAFEMGKKMGKQMAKP